MSSSIVVEDVGGGVNGVASASSSSSRQQPVVVVEDFDYAEQEEQSSSSDYDIDEDDRMLLSENERNLAIMIKEAIADDPELEPISDFMCAQLAIIDNDDIETALERVRHLQHFREEYGILDTVEDGLQRFAQYVELFPEVHLSFTTDYPCGNTTSSVMVFDNTKFYISNLSGMDEQKINIWLGGSYYTVTIFSKDFEAIRSGTILVFECEGYDLWKKRGISFNSLKRVWSEIATVYPMTFQKAIYNNAGTTMNLVVSMMKPFLPKGLRSRIEFETFPQRLDQIYLIPTVEQANRRFLKRVEDTLENRYKNEKEFKL